MLTPSTEESSHLKNKGMVLVSWFIGKIGFMKEAGQTTNVMEKDMKDTQTEIPTKVIFNEEKHMVKVCIIGPTVKYMMVNGAKV